MARSLYRFYLYSVSSALLIFAITAFGTLASTFFALTPLRGQYGSVPSQAQLVQSISYACIAFLISGMFGGLHYWLIRRDMRQDIQAGNSAIRAFFLHTLEGISVVFGVALLGATFAMLGSSTAPNVATLLASALSFLLLAFLVDLERRRSSELSGLAQVFQRIHFFGTQIILLAIVTFFFLVLQYVRTLADMWFFYGQARNENCYLCSSSNAFWLAVSLLWVAGAWILYSWMTYKDRSLPTRLIFHGFGLAYGVAVFLNGFYMLLAWLLRLISGHGVPLSQVLGYSANMDFVSPLILGCLIVPVYMLLLRGTERWQLLRPGMFVLTIQAIIGGTMAAFFWVGAGRLLYDGLRTWFHIGDMPDVREWLEALALTITGIGYIALDWVLHRQYRLNSELASGPRRGFVLTLLGAGVITGAIGLAMALYASITAFLGSAVGDWQRVTLWGVTALVVGVALVALYLPASLHEHLFKSAEHHHEAEVPHVPVIEQSEGMSEVSTQPVEPASLATVEEVLDALLAAKISRDEAASRLHTLIGSTKTD